MVEPRVRAKRRAPNKRGKEAKAKPALAFLFDLDGTLVDSTYQHAFAWQQALEKVGIELAAWRIHRRMGMSGGLFLSALAREIGRRISRPEAMRLARLHDEVYARLASKVHALPGARQLLNVLTHARVPWAIATSGRMNSARPMLAILHAAKDVIVITRDHVQRAKPDPDLFLAAAARLQTAITDCVVVGDSVWDMLAAQRARALGVGLLSGGLARTNW
jgi:HAD superfamily hydrolase (TIGR01509 family)